MRRLPPSKRRLHQGIQSLQTWPETCATTSEGVAWLVAVNPAAACCVMAGAAATESTTDSEDDGR